MDGSGLVRNFPRMERLRRLGVSDVLQTKLLWLVIKALAIYLVFRAHLSSDEEF